MNKISILIILILVWLCNGCDSWLEVNPANEVSKEKLFETESGFEKALNGIYLASASTSLYGQQLSWGFLSVIAQTYEDLNTNNLYYASQYDYESSHVLPIITNIWEDLYNVVANCNMLLNEVDKASPGIFILDTLSKDVIRGEALAMRAMCHFDLVRLFAPAPGTTGGQEKLIPYQVEYPAKMKIPGTTMETLDLIIDDLLEAKDLLAYHDTLYNATWRNNVWNNQATWFNNQYGNKGSAFYGYRGYRMNYCAVVGMLSRVYLWKGDTEEALVYAKHFFERFGPGRKDRTGFFQFSTGKDPSSSSIPNHKYMSECFFGLQLSDLPEVISSYYTKSKIGLPIACVDEIFGDDIDDLRYSFIEKDRKVDLYGDGNYVYNFDYCIKLEEAGSQSVHFEKRSIPILRLSEMYYTMIECYYLRDEKEKALELLNEFRKKKLIYRSLELNDIGTLDDLYDVLINDARREWMQEGQLFFMYKRLNHEILSKDGVVPLKEEMITLDIPDSQYVN